MARRLIVELQLRPAQDHIRLTCHTQIGDRELSAGQSDFWQRLRRKPAIEYFAINEWHDGQRHVHALARHDGAIDSDLIGRLWRQVLPGHRLSHSCAPIRDQAAISRYILKLAESPPPTFGGRLYSSSRGFLNE
jgi:hypothetical protein